jgi:hypothetical protein
MFVASYSIKVKEKHLFFITSELRKMKQKGLKRKGLAEKKMLNIDIEKHQHWNALLC